MWLWNERRMDGLLGEEMQIEIDLNKIERGTHEGRVKVTRGGKTFYRKQRVGQKEKPETDGKLDFIMGDIKIKEKIESAFGREIVDAYNEKLSNMDEAGLMGEFDELLKDDKYRKEFIGEWGHLASSIDGWTTELLGLNKDNSRQYFHDDKYVSPSGKKETWMKSILLNVTLVYQFGINVFISFRFSIFFCSFVSCWNCCN